MKNNTNSLNQLESTLELYFVKKAPAMPANIKELIVSFAPWLTLIFGIMAIPFVLMALGVGSFLAPFAMMASVYAGPQLIISGIITLAVIVMELAAVPGLFKRKMSAWRLVFYATLLSLLSQLVTFSIVGFIISGLIGLYVLFQVKSLYK